MEVHFRLRSLRRTGEPAVGAPVAIGLGANLGDATAAIEAAVASLALLLEGARTSALYASAPMYDADQPRFVNAVLYGWTVLGPFELLVRLRGIEETLGRQRRRPNGPREIDLDLLVYGALRLRSSRLTLPHARMGERKFVLAPLAEVAPRLVVPGLGAVSELLLAVADQDCEPVGGGSGTHWACPSQ